MRFQRFSTHLIRSDSSQSNTNWSLLSSIATSDFKLQHCNKFTKKFTMKQLDIVLSCYLDPSCHFPVNTSVLWFGSIFNGYHWHIRTNVTSFTMQRIAENACLNRMCQRIFNSGYSELLDPAWNGRWHLWFLEMLLVSTVKISTFSSTDAVEMFDTKIELFLKNTIIVMLK